MLTYSFLAHEPFSFGAVKIIAGNSDFVFVLSAGIVNILQSGQKRPVIQVEDFHRNLLFTSCGKTNSNKYKNDKTKNNFFHASTSPSCIRITRSAVLASSGSCVTISMVIPCFLCNSLNITIMASPVAESRLPVGSSAKTIFG